MRDTKQPEDQKKTDVRSSTPLKRRVNNHTGVRFITVKIYFIQHFTLQILKNYAYCYK